MLEDTHNGESRLDVEACSAPAADQGYKVGYGRPPLESRFKPGTSGNKKGRPKGSRNTKSIVEEVINSPVTVRENGKARKTTKLRAVIEATTLSAMKGDIRAVNALVALLIRIGHLDQPEHEGLMTCLPQEDEAIINNYLRRQFAGAESPVANDGEKR
jgi:hypothetical protein